tara:strand:+ start:14367 stop:15404 length:1038 start_codon:yes stop_codon:yes gene_type:complete
MSKETYESAGVNIAAGEEAVQRITPLIEKTLRPEVLTKIGGFGGAFDITQTGKAHPVLVSSTDGVGTKAQVAMMAEQYESIGIDLVAMCVDDLVCVGAEPLFFLDYISVGTLIPDQVELLVKGISDACEEAGCALIGGEMAEHPGLMQAGEFELVGFSVGVVDKDQMITGESVNTDDVIIGLHSPGLRSNGYSLARKVLLDTAKKSIHEPVWEGTDITVGEELLRPSVIYTPTILKILERNPIKAIAHITGGGLPGNVNRVLPNNMDAQISKDTWTPPRIFTEIQSLGNIDAGEMFKVFNMGIGMVLIVDQQSVDITQEIINSTGLSSTQIGTVKANGTGSVQIV